jgi:sugar lactone lactonase YvrE
VGLTFDDAGNIYIATHGASAAEKGKVGLKDVVRVDRSGRMSVVATYRCFAFQYLEFGKDGYIYASVAKDYPNLQGEVLKISRDGNITVLCTGFLQPAAIVFDPAGTPFVLDAQENRVYRIDGENRRTVFIELHLPQVQSPGYNVRIDYR